MTPEFVGHIAGSTFGIGLIGTEKNVSARHRYGKGVGDTFETLIGVHPII
jgi:hypothetical protein